MYYYNLDYKNNKLKFTFASYEYCYYYIDSDAITLKFYNNIGECLTFIRKLS